MTNPFSTIQLYAVGAIVVAALGLFTYHKVVVSSQATKIERLESANTQLKADVSVAVTANKSMQTQVDRIAAQSTQLVEILKSVQSKDNQVAQWFEAARNQLNANTDKNDIVEKLKTNPTETIDNLNKDIDCTIANFGKVGICKDGVFVPFQQ